MRAWWVVLGVVAAVLGVLYVNRKTLASLKPAAQWSLSQAGIDEIKKHEGWSATVYRDVAGLATIGYGHLVKAGEVFASAITREQGEQILRKDLATAEAAVRRLVVVPISQGMYDALVSWVFNLGGGSLQSSTLLKKLNAGDYIGAAAEFLKWDKAKDPKTGQLVAVKGLTTRREAEKSTFLQGVA